MMARFCHHEGMATDDTKARDVQEFLLTRIDTLADRAAINYQQSGRGLWMAVLTGDPSDVSYDWATAERFEQLAAQVDASPEVVDAVTGLMATYDPQHEFVLYLMHPDGLPDWQIVCHAPKGWG